MKGIVEERAAMLGEYIIESKATVRSTAKKFGVSKSTVHKDVSQRLKVLNPALYRQVREILDTNKSERHIRGGLATKKKYLQKKASESEKNRKSTAIRLIHHTKPHFQSIFWVFWNFTFYDLRCII